MIRLFVALGLPDGTRQHLALLQGGIPGARWSPPDNFHLTLRFIGEVDEALAGDIDDVLSTLRGAPFPLTLKGAGSFGGRDAHSLWVGVAPCEPLLQLAARVEIALQRIGLKAEGRKFTPHVTLARLRDAPPNRVQGFLADHSLFSSGPFPVDRFGLYSSHPTAHGSQYVLERSYPLG